MKEDVSCGLYRHCSPLLVYTAVRFGVTKSFQGNKWRFETQRIYRQIKAAHFYFPSSSSSFLLFSLLPHLLLISIVFPCLPRKGQRGQNQTIKFEFGLIGLILTSLFSRENNRNEEKVEEEEEEEEEEDEGKQ